MFIEAFYIHKIWFNLVSILTIHRVREEEDQVK